MAVVARFGLAARAFIYLVIGALAIEIAFGHRGQEADQRGALAAIAQHSYGVDLLWLLGAGFAAYALWRLSEAAFGTAADGDKAGQCAKSLARGIIYGAFAVSTFGFIAGTSRQGQAQQQETVTARVMKNEPGRWLVGLIGLVVAVAGALVVDAAITYDPSKSSGLDGALRTLADRPYGPWLLVLLAVGLIVFGIYGLAAARWTKI